MAKFKLICGSHNENGKDYKAGAIVSSKVDLEAVFGAAKFQRVGKTASSPEPEPPQSPAKQPSSVQQPAEGQEAAGEPSGDPGALQSQYGDDITQLFPEAKELGVVIFKKGKWFNVFKSGERLNSKGLERTGVAMLLEGMLDDQE